MKICKQFANIIYKYMKTDVNKLIKKPYNCRKIPIYLDLFIDIC